MKTTLLGARSEQNEALAKILAKLETIIDWERKDRSNMRVNVAPVRDLLRRLGNPERTFRSLHVTGTKGKGSVCSLLESALASAGIRVGRYSSPHVERVTERITFNGVEISEELLAEKLRLAWNARTSAVNDGTEGTNATWFDLMTVGAFLAFAEAKIEWAVVEVGIGGLFDSTNVIDAEVAIVTNVELEHTTILGSTRAQIARQKVGIAKDGAVLVSGVPMDDEAGRVIGEAATSLNIPLIVLPPQPNERIDEVNARLAGAVLDILGSKHVVTRVPAYGQEAESTVGSWLLNAKTIAAARLPGRMERLDVSGGVFSEPPIVGPVPVMLDGAHVPFNLVSVLRDVSSEPDLAGQCVAILGLGRDKNAPDMLSALTNRARFVIFPVWSGGFPTFKPEELLALANELDLKAEVVASPRESLRRAFQIVRDKEWIFVTGSLHLIGEVRPILVPHARAR